MKILITSGGTRVKIDAVRFITNMSRGTFGSKICSEFAKDWENDITFFHAKNSKMPMECGFANIHTVEYDTFDEYRQRLTDLLKKERFDIIVLAAAVSDYGVDNYFDGKYHSSDAMNIRLKPLPKVITEVRKLAPDSVICGFKLLVDSTDEQLHDAMLKQISENGIDLCIGNDLRDIKNDNHRLTIRKANSDEWEVYTKKQCAVPLECKVVGACMEVFKNRPTKKSDPNQEGNSSFKKIIRAAMSIIAIAECDDDCFADDFCKDDYIKCLDTIKENLDAIDAEFRKAKGK